MLFLCTLQYCPEPVTEEEIKLQEAEDVQHVRGRVRYAISAKHTSHILKWYQLDD
jgi:hypothetical protein